MTHLLLLLLAADPVLVVNSTPIKVGNSTDGGTLLNVNIAGGSSSGGLTNTELRAAAVPVSLATVPSHAVTGTFFQATQPVSLATAPTTPVTGTFWQATQPVSGTVTATVTGATLAAGSAVIGHVIHDTGSTTAVTGNVTAVQATGSNLHVVVDTAPTTAVTHAGLTNLDVALSTRTKPADQQHTIIDSSATIPVSGSVTATVASTTITGTVATSLAVVPAHQVQALGADGGTTFDVTGSQVGLSGPVYVFVSSPPLNPFLPRCNKVRTRGCQP